MSTLGSRMHDLREKRGWTKTHAAKQLGIKTMSTYANWEYDLRQPDNEMLLKIAELYEVSTDYLLGTPENKEAPHREAGISDNEYNKLSAYQKEVIDFFVTRENLAFKNQPENILDALEEFEIFYEYWKKKQKDKNN